MKMLGIVFSDSEWGPLAGIAAQVGCDWDVVAVGVSARVCGQTRSWHVAEGASSVESLVLALGPIAREASHVVSITSMRAKDVLAGLAGALGWPMITDAVEIESSEVFVRPVLAGAALERVQALGGRVVLTARPAAFEKRPVGDFVASEALAVQTGLGPELVSQEVHSGGRPDLAGARVVVSGGRPLADAETFERVIGGLADALHGAVGATRAAVDSGIAPNELQVGQTGKIVAPQVYVAAGVSGSTQHLAGIKDSKTIVAVNTDPDAPIFEFADVGIVADLYEVLPRLEALARSRG